jgi:GH25 family lysozyme M1 (1,4-beta-N-acetylmuramidase)
MKQAFIYWPKKKLTEHDDDEEIICEPIDPPVQEVEMDLEQDKHIVDISKWQGTINFEALKEDVSLVIARASCGSDKDSKIASYALSMDRLEIPYGVYCYSYARDAAKATDEVEKLLEYTKTCHPLFYVMDAEEACITNDTIRVFAQELRKRTTKPIGCYVANHKYAAYKYDSVRDLFDFTWIPHYGKNTGMLEGATKPKYKCDLWQYTSKGKVNGIRGDADLNIITGEGHDLAWFLGKGE